jgi:hypothetical protein
VAACGEVPRLGRLAAGDGGLLAAVPRPPTVVIEPDGTLGKPAALGRYGEDPSALYLTGPYTMPATSFTVPVAGSYGVWIGGTFRPRVDVSLDGRPVGSARNVLDWPSTYVPIGTARLAAGVHTLFFHFGGAGLLPGGAGLAQFGTGPIAIGIGTAERPVTYLRPENARMLCGKRLDWVEAVAR